MFSRIFFTRLKCYIRTKEFVFWILMFPIILTTLFKIGFANIMESEKFDVIDMAYCVEKNASYEYKDVFSKVLKIMSEPGENQVFNIIEADDAECRKMLSDNDADAYLKISDKPELFLLKNGISQTIAKETIDIILKKISLAGEIYIQTQTVPQNIGQDIQTYIERKTSGRSEPDATSTYFFAALAMTCMYGALMGVYEIICLQANLSAVAMRNSMSPVSKLTQFLAGFAAGGTVQISMCVLVLVYIRYVLRIDFGDRSGYVYLTTIVGSLTGICIGMAISAVVKKSEGVKIGIVTSYTMLCSFFSGLMISTMRYIVHEKAPLVDMLNPVARITDCFYRLYYYDSLKGFWINIAVLVAMAVVCTVVTVITIRRQKYDSI